jgi:hypothetical protein
LGQAYKYGVVKSINGIPTLLSSVLNVRGLKIEILHVELLCFVISSGFFFIKDLYACPKIVPGFPTKYGIFCVQ